MRLLKALPLILIGLYYLGITSAPIAAQSTIDLYPAHPSPNWCTASYGDDHFLRTSGVCQPCNTVHDAYKRFYKICEFTQWPGNPNPTVKTIKLNCQSLPHGSEAYNECNVGSRIHDAWILDDSESIRRCELDRTWGFADDYIWVARGCSALFEVCLSRRCDDTVIIEPKPPACYPSRPYGWVSYTVQPGDTLYSLANRTGSTMYQLKSVNCIEDQNLIYTGSTLYLPRHPAPIIIPPIGPGDEDIIIDPIPVDPEDPIIILDPILPGPSVIQMVCMSEGELGGYCPLSNPGVNIRLVEQLSSESCRLNESFGLEREGDGVWVDYGCSGIFEVTVQ